MSSLATDSKLIALEPLWTSSTQD